MVDVVEKHFVWHISYTFYTFFFYTFPMLFVNFCLCVCVTSLPLFLTVCVTKAATEIILYAHRNTWLYTTMFVSVCTLHDRVYADAWPHAWSQSLHSRPDFPRDHSQHPTMFHVENLKRISAPCVTCHTCGKSWLSGSVDPQRSVCGVTCGPRSMAATAQCPSSSLVPNCLLNRLFVVGELVLNRFSIRNTMCRGVDFCFPFRICSVHYRQLCNIVVHCT